MKIENLSVTSNGYVRCKSVFYSTHDVLVNSDYFFSVGMNKLIGEIDSGVWGISYLLSMYPHAPKEFTLFEQPTIMINNSCISLDEFSKYSCYMDKSYPLFLSRKPVYKLVLKGIKTTKSTILPEEIRDIFHISRERFERPMISAGNEVFRVMAAIAHAYDKQVFCFPWFSQMRFKSYHNHMIDLQNILESLHKIIILPLGK